MICVDLSDVKDLPLSPLFSLRLGAVAQIAHTLQAVKTMVDLYANETAVMGLQPVNEPWQFTPLDWLKVRPLLAFMNLKNRQEEKISHASAVPAAFCEIGDFSRNSRLCKPAGCDASIVPALSVAGAVFRSVAVLHELARPRLNG